MAMILVVEDDIDIAQGIAEYLESAGHSLDFAYTGKQALDLLATSPYQLVLLDLNLPLVDGLEVCRSLVAGPLTQVPVIIMSARAEERDILQGFDCGAWDYLVKPFSFSELLARISANLAKAGAGSLPDGQTVAGAATLFHGDMSLHFGGASIQLHSAGFGILKLLMESSPSVVQTSLIHRTLWQEDTPDSDPLRAHIYKLRRAMQQHFGENFIYTVKGVGYQFRTPEGGGNDT